MHLSFQHKALNYQRGGCAKHCVYVRVFACVWVAFVCDYVGPNQSTQLLTNEQIKMIWGMMLWFVSSVWLSVTVVWLTAVFVVLLSCPEAEKVMFPHSKSVVYQEKSLKSPTEPEVIRRHLTQGRSSYSLMCCIFLCRLWSFLGTAQTDKSSPSSSSSLALTPLSSHLFHLGCLKVQYLRMLIKMTIRMWGNSRFDVVKRLCIMLMSTDVSMLTS